MKRKRIYLFACVEKNIGDDLFVYIVSNRYKNVDFIMTNEAKYLSVNALPNIIYSKRLKKWLKFSSINTNNKTKKSIAYLLERLMSFSLKKYDSIYIVGNAFKNMNYSGKFQIQWLYNRLKISNKFFLISTNFGPTNDDRWINDCKNVFSLMTDVCFRDKTSFLLFNDLKNVRYAPDAVLSLNTNSGITPMNREKYIIISIIDCKMPERGNVINEISDCFESKMIEIINSYNKDNIKVVLLNSNSEQDGPSSSRIYNSCLNKEMVSIFNYNGNLQEVFSLYNHAQGVIATRLHTIILAWIYNIPVYPITYDIKVDNLLLSYNFKEKYTKIENIKMIDYHLIKTALDNYKFVLSREILEKSNDQFKLIDKYLLGGSINEK